ncbi:MAG: LysR family transcriptional regulator [Gammaproteobacteria bacterium]|nr:MAG: LysR family transcriptional regulator [Gammaproteobacteria bacterium]
MGSEFGLGSNMDTELLRTFLEVRKTRHFARAAENLFITQAAVSARIRQLEDRIGHRLFTRDRRNIQLTAAGRELVPYAESILDTWHKALLETGAGGLPLLVIGCLASLREIYLDDWLLSLVEGNVVPRLELESLNTLETIRRARDGSLDVGMVYEAPRAPDLWVEALTTFELELVATKDGVVFGSDLENYVHVDWGTSLGAAQDTQQPGVIGTRARLDSAVLARKMVLAVGGCAFLPRPLVADDIESGVLHRVSDSPKPRRSVFLIGAKDRRSAPGLEELVAALHDLAGSEEGG